MPSIKTDDGVQLNYQIEDFREPWSREPAATVLLHHGYCKNLEFWTPFVPGVARHYRVVRYDARGHGKSSVPPKGATWSLERLVKDVVTVLDALEIEKVHFVGFESGGVVGFSFAANRPERIQSLAMFNTPAGGWMTTGRMKNYFNVGYPHIADAIDALGVEEWITRTLPIWADPTFDPAAIDWVRRESAKTPLEVNKSWDKVMEGSDISDLPGRVTVPTLLVAGADHTFGCKPPLLDQLRRMIPKGREVVYIPGVASAVQLLKPDESAAALVEFLRSLNGAKPA